MERLSENSRGITLIALIITVVIMLILAGVAISAVIDDGGLFSKTREAVAKYENSVEVENSQLQNLLAQIDATLDGTEIPGTESKIGVKTVEGMVPVTYNDGDSSWYVATEEEITNGTWYDYVDTSIAGNENQSKWANVMLRDNLQVEGVTNASTATLEEMYGKKVTSFGATEAGNVLTSDSVIVRTVGNVSSWRSINRNNIFLNCYNMNSEDNAAIYGIYDMAGGAWEHVAAYVDSTQGGTVANNYLTSTDYGKAVYDAADKYKDVYVIGKSDDRVRNYAANADKYGDGIFETSYTSYDGTSYTGSGWFQDHTRFPFSSYPFFYRGGAYDSGAHAGVFA